MKHAYVVDKNPAKQGKNLPGSRIPIVAEERLHSDRPAYIVILPWNITAEIMEQLAYVSEWGARFVTGRAQADNSLASLCSSVLSVVKK